LANLRSARAVNRTTFGKRPLHTIIPGMVTQGGRARTSFGVMGDHYEAMGHAHFLSKVLRYGMDMQSAMNLPRIFPRQGADSVDVEATMPAAVCATLADRGVARTRKRTTTVVAVAQFQRRRFHGRRA
jgi:gamma-glutamyltranspeptidase